MNRNNDKVDRNKRELLTGTAAIASLATLPGGRVEARSAADANEGVSAARNGVYETVPLAKPSVSQSPPAATRFIRLLPPSGPHFSCRAEHPPVSDECEKGSPTGSSRIAQLPKTADYTT